MLIAAGSILFIVYARSLDLERVLPTLLDFDVGIGVILLLLSLASGIAKYARWEGLLRLQKEWIGCNRLDEFLAVSASFFVGLVTPGTAGELARGTLSRIDSHRAIALVTLEKLTDLLVLVGLVAFSLSLWVKGWGLSTMVLLSSATFATGSYWLIRRRSSLVRHGIARLGRLLRQEDRADRVVDVLRPFKDTIHDSRLVAYSTLVSVVLWIIPSIQMYLMLRLLHGSVSFSTSAVLFLVPYLLGILSLVPAGIGVFDASAGSLLGRALTMDGPALLVLAPLYFRVFATIPLIAFGYMSLLIGQYRGAVRKQTPVPVRAVPTPRSAVRRRKE